MREIKFRAWDKENKRMLYVSDINFCGEEISAYDREEYIGFNYIELMQFTGRQDINGKEVYEGDIVKCFDNYYKMYYIGVVDFADCSFVIKNDACTYYRWQDYRVEIVGNIYENPELLEGVK